MALQSYTEEGEAKGHLSGKDNIKYTFTDWAIISSLERN